MILFLVREEAVQRSPRRAKRTESLLLTGILRVPRVSDANRQALLKLMYTFKLQALATFVMGIRVAAIKIEQPSERRARFCLRDNDSFRVRCVAVCCSSLIKVDDDYDASIA